CRLPVSEERNERDEKDRRGSDESAARRPPRYNCLLFPLLPLFDPLFTAEHVGELLPEEAQADRRPDSPCGKAPDVEVVSVAHLARHVLRARVLRPAVLEIEIVDERERHREHQRTEIPERSPASLPCHFSPEDAGG